VVTDILNLMSTHFMLIWWTPQPWI